MEDSFMSEEYVSINYLFIKKFNPKFISDLINYSLNIGCTTNKDGDVSLCNYSSKNTNWDIIFNSNITDAIKNISKNNAGSFQLWYKDTDFMLQINLKGKIDPNIQHIAISFDPLFFREYDENSRLFSEFNVKNTIELSIELYKFTKALYIYGEGENSISDEYNIKLTKDELIGGAVKNLFWINILSPPFVKIIGREKLLSAPAWKIEGLADGGILLVLAPNPLNVIEVNKKKAEVEKHLGLKK